VTELWERFAYYGLRALLILYLIDTEAGGMGWTQERASHLYGWFVGLTYLSPVAGGWLADRILGTNRALVVGGIILVGGYFCLALGPGLPFYTGLALIVLGTGFFKPNMHTIVGQLYGPGDVRRDSGFTLYYMGINLGAFLGPLVCAWLAARYGWRQGFAAGCAAMSIGLAFYLRTRRSRLGEIGLAPATTKGGTDEDRRLTPGERGRITAIALITVFVVFFWLAFEQAGSSLNVFASQRTSRQAVEWLRWTLPHGEIPAGWFQSINPLCILLLAPLMASFWQRLGRHAPSSPAKMGLGLILLGLAYVVMVVGAGQSGGGARVSPLYLVVFYVMYSLGELCFLPVAISFVAHTAPARLASMLMGVWLTANFVANLLGGYMAGMVQRIERGELFRILGGQADFFLIFVVCCVLAGVLLLALAPRVRRLAEKPGSV
jgi:proton-dependent oligopeptide transporter, POT family